MDTTILTVVNKIRELGGFTVAGLAAGEFLRLQRVDNQVGLLRTSMQFWMAWIQMAEMGNSDKRDQLLNVWESKLRDAVFDAEDIIDEYFQEVYQSRPGFETRARRRWPCTLCFRFPDVPCFWFRFPEIPCFHFSEIPVRYDLSWQIKAVLKRLENISLSDMQARVEAMATRTTQALDVPTMKTLSQEVPRCDAIGFHGHVQSIISLLLEDNGKSGAIVVVTGESGVGKTTVVSEVLRAWNVQRHFDVCAWPCLPPNSRVDSYVNQIWEQVKEQTHCGLRTADRKRVLDKIKALVVLDGMDSMDVLVDVLSKVRDVAKGSRIVVTTELPIKEIKGRIHGVELVEIERLQQNECLSLFARGLPGIAHGCYEEHRTEWAAKIYENTGGLPLAIVLLRGLVYFKDHEAQWDEVFAQLKSRQQDKRVIKRILSVSYATMPTIIKLCFLYLSGMSPNVHLDCKKLQRFWCAEGIIEPELRGIRTEDSVTRQCLCILVSRGLVQRVGDRVCMHPSVHEFAETMARKTRFMEARSKFDFDGASTVRGLSLRNYAKREMHMHNSFPKLRTLLADFAEDPVGEEAAHRPTPSETSNPEGLNQSSSRLEFLSQSRFLRVLDMNGAKIGELPDSIGDMIHLRYLGLRSCCLRNLPPSVVRLLNLETLDITDNQVRKVEDEFWKIEKLKHVLAQSLSLPESASSMGSATKLETLHGVTLPSLSTPNNCPLKKMSKLFSLQVSVMGATAVNVRVLAKALEDISDLRHIKIAGDCIPLLLLDRTLESLELDGNIMSHVDVVAAQSSDSRTPIRACNVVMRSSRMSQVFLDSVFNPSYIQELELLDNSFAESKLLLQGLELLTRLKIGNLKELEVLVIPDSGVPNLMTLEIFGCPNLKIIQGLKDSKHLQSVIFHDMPAIVEQIIAEDDGLSNKIKHVETSAWATTT